MIRKQILNPVLEILEKTNINTHITDYITASIRDLLYINTNELRANNLFQVGRTTHNMIRAAL